MKKLPPILAISFACAALGAYYFSDAPSIQSNAAIQGQTSHATAGGALNGAAGVGQLKADGKLTSGGNLAQASWQASPFAGGAGKLGAEAPSGAAAGLEAKRPDAEVVPPEEQARRKKMEALGYMVPTDYYQKDLRTLRQLAKSGDAFAMVHLGEKYYFELNGREQSPEYEKGLDYAREARQSFSQALAAGNVRSAAIIAETYLQENNKVDAYAWHILSEQLGDSISADWFKRTELYASLTEQDKLNARQKLPTLIDNVNKLSLQMKLKPVFSG